MKMQYEGDVYGKVAGKYFPVGTTKAVCKKDEVIKKLKAEIEKIVAGYDGVNRMEAIGRGMTYDMYAIEALEKAIHIVSECE